MSLQRRHYAFTAEIEKRLLDWIASPLHRYVTADQLSLLALMAALLTGGSYLAAAHNLNWLHLANLGIFLHWFGDSLDGRTARLRQENRPNYGHYLDHILDAVSLVIIIFGINYSGLTLQSGWIWTMALFLLIMIHAFLRASVTGIFQLSIANFGPTEARLSLILMNLILIFTANPQLILHPFPATLLDLFGISASLLLLGYFLLAVYQSLFGKDKIQEHGHPGNSQPNH